MISIVKIRDIQEIKNDLLQKIARNEYEEWELTSLKNTLELSGTGVKYDTKNGKSPQSTFNNAIKKKIDSFKNQSETNHNPTTPDQPEEVSNIGRKTVDSHTFAW